MPCRMDDMPDTSKDDLIDKLRKEGDKATRLLCTALEHFEGHAQSAYDELPKEVRNWWDKHKEVDKKRLKREKIQAEIDKLKEQLKDI